jgi:hypothetical protein
MHGQSRRFSAKATSGCCQIISKCNTLAIKKRIWVNFSKSNDVEFLNTISQIAETIINNEFGLYLDIDDKLMFNIYL